MVTGGIGHCGLWAPGMRSRVTAGCMALGKGVSAVSGPSLGIVGPGSQQQVAAGEVQADDWRGLGHVGAQQQLL